MTEMTENEANRHNAFVLAASDWRAAVRQLDNTLRQAEQSTALAQVRQLLDCARDIASELAKDIRDELAEDTANAKAERKTP